MKPNFLQRRPLLLAVCLLGLVAGFIHPLTRLVLYGFKNAMYSHVVLIPLVSAYLIWLRRDRLQRPFTASPPGAAALLILAGTALLGLKAALGRAGATFDPNDTLGFQTAAFVLLVLAAFVLCLGIHAFRQWMFPLLLLFFMVPLPSRVTLGLMRGLQHGTAWAAYSLLELVGMPVVRNGTTFYLPGLSLEVAQECSGINSTYVLFVTSLIAGYILLRSTWTRVAFCLCAFPLGILRNSLRIMTLSLLTIYVDPDVIHSPLHHRGGPLFFVLSLVPLFILLLVLMRWERRRQRAHDREKQPLRQP